MKRLLVCDDNIVNRSILTDYLYSLSKEEDFIIVEADSVIEMAKMIQRKEYDLLFLSTGMRELRKYSLKVILEGVRQMDSDMPIILTASAMDERKLVDYIMLVDNINFLKKPFDKKRVHFVTNTLLFNEK